jgi:hypothetical protein
MRYNRFGPQKKRRGRPPRAIPEATIAAALIKHDGLQYLAADELDMTGNLMCKRIAESPMLTEIRDDCKQRRIDMAEKRLHELVCDRSKNNLGAICFTLKCLGKSRGYSDVPNDGMVSLDTTRNFTLFMNQLRDAQSLNKDDNKTNNEQKS